MVAEQELFDDFRDMLLAVAAAGVEHVVVGGHARSVVRRGHRGDVCRLKWLARVPGHRASGVDRQQACERPAQRSRGRRRTRRGVSRLSSCPFGVSDPVSSAGNRRHWTSCRITSTHTWERCPTRSATTRGLPSRGSSPTPTPTALLRSPCSPQEGSERWRSAKPSRWSEAL